ncbi:MAG: ATP synthase subunit I [Gallionella sp.]|nr:ATP synthase subunit I [Gallionella sp.]
MSKEAVDVQKAGLTHPENAATIPALLLVDLLQVDAEEKQIAQRVVVVQLVVTLVVTGIAYSLKSSPQLAIALLAGGAVSVFNGAQLAWRMSRSARQLSQEAHHQLRLMYFYAIERFLVVVMLLGLCMVVLKLMPLAVLGGFVIGQAALIVARLFLSRITT